MMNRSRTSSDLVALTVLSLLTEQPRHTYELQRLIQERHKDFAMGRTRALYHAVDRLARDGLIEPVETSREGKRPERTVYRITDAGADECQSWVEDLLKAPGQEFPLITVAVSFLANLPQDTALRALQSRTVALQSMIAGLDAALRSLIDDLHLPRLVLLEQECLQALRHAELAWVRGLIDEIRSGSMSWSREALEEMFALHHTTTTTARASRDEETG
jgi:DNA-binding PadR family transcriptional regulator